MSRKNVLFYLLPISNQAKDVLNDQENAFLVDRAGPVTRLAIGHFQSKAKNRTTLATIGRLGDITLRGTGYSRYQCSFHVDLNTNVIMFYDDSRAGTSSVLGPDSTPFRPGQPRRVVVQPNVNTIIGMGGERRDLVTFKLDWPFEPPETMALVERRDLKSLALNPRFARTDSDNAETAVPTMPQTRIHSSLPKRPMVRWAKIEELGAGAFGQVRNLLLKATTFGVRDANTGKVFRAVDVDSGRLIAVKIIKIRQKQKKEAFFSLLKREVEAIGRIEHPFVVDYICSEASIDAPQAQVVMGLMKGSLYSLLEGKTTSPDHLNETADLMLTHMLQALDCVASMGIVHRDVKPENILYTYSPNRELVFKLGDFGLCNQMAAAQSAAGTPIYMAPEISSRAQGQTPKADIWSLFMVLVWIYDFKGFRRAAYAGQLTVSALLQLAREATAPGQRLAQLGEMARLDPEKRASAAQIMLKFGLFSQEPRAILCSHGKDPRSIPAMPPDEPPPAASRPGPRPAGQPSGKGSAAKKSPSSDVSMTGTSRSFFGSMVK